MDAAIHARLPHGGWCPKGRKAEDGVIPEQYLLTEMKSADYLKRTEANVVDSDATLIFTDGPLTGGSKRTAEFCEKHGKPWLHIDLKAEEQTVPGLVAPYRQPHVVDRIRAWLDGAAEFEGRGCRIPDDCVLNVAGQRESKAPMLQHRVKILLIDLLIAVGAAKVAFLTNDQV